MTKTVSHTPGFWSLKDHGDVTCIYGKSAKGRLADVHSFTAGHGPDRKERAANARLIAAAPELLEALQALQLQALQSPDLRRTEWGQEALAMTAAAIAKATGAAQ